ncbi:MAG: DUF4954 family protein [Spirochaetia bacterium]|nr:DUF4954 family protein [Spirochaetia bacterium]MDD7699657.1 DUF4954 family protein [Spirochaetia bacterium]MDY4211943.1 DUF4954 family protein [Treponema sp.]
MVTLNYIEKINPVVFPEGTTENKRNLSKAEIEILLKNGNVSDFEDWSNVLVSSIDGEFNPQLIYNSHFSGFVVLGRIKHAVLKFHDLELVAGIYNSNLIDVIVSDDVVIRNVKYLKNYRIGNRVILFNIQEMSCTEHSKFGNGWLKKDETEDVRVWIGVGNENDNRAVLPFESMITADAYLWSRRRDDSLLMKRFIEITENENDKSKRTFGIVEDEAVIKNTTLLKDAKIGKCAYIKGAFKLKNITVLSSEEEESQIGEGVELVNGIMGYGSRIFYQAVAVRFVIGRNCQLKYGARLLNSILGDNSTVSCCELLNNLIFPFHEQHHNSSFLIATTILGQSNIAAGATIGSNHNSRSPDGEIYAGRGFWPGLCSDFKHNSKFASFVLVSKGSYQHELNITYPFSLVAFKAEQEPIHIIPAYWFLFNMFAIARNNYKFKKRDKRVQKVQHIETDPLAPDAMQEVLVALDRLILLTRDYLKRISEENVLSARTEQEELQAAKDYLHQNTEADFTLFDLQAQKKYGATIFKPVKAYKEYRKILKYFAARSIIEYCKSNGYEKFSREVLEKIEKISLFTEWTNAGGQIIPTIKINQLCEKIKSGQINSWNEIHSYYDSCQKNYELYKCRYALYILEKLYTRPILEFSSEIFQDIIDDVTIVSTDMYRDSIYSRQKDYTDPFRAMTYENQEEMTAVLGTIDDNEFLHILRAQTESFNLDLRVILGQ